MASIENSHSGMGHLGQDPILRHTTQGTAVTTLSVAMNEKYKNGEGDLKEITTWMPIQVWGPNAENACKYLHKGSLIAWEGSMRLRSWEDKEGVKRWVMECRANTIKYLDPAPDRPKQAPTPDDAEQEAPIAIPEDDIPF